MGNNGELAEKAGEGNEFEDVKARLEEIARAVDDEGLSLDDALDLYEEAVKLGLKASSLLEVGIVVEDNPAESEEANSADSASPQVDGSAVGDDGTASK